MGEDIVVAEAPVENSVLAVLRGGPASVPLASRSRMVDLSLEKIKLFHHGGYEHFERIHAPEEDQSPQEIVFRWTMRTEVAE